MEIGAGDLQVQNRLPECLVFGMKQSFSLGAISGLQTDLLFGHGVLGVEFAVVPLI
jgi:hypothetical protein